MHRSSLALPLLLLFLAAACGSDGGDAPDQGTRPITERTARATYQCSVEQDRVDLAPKQWAAPPALAATTAGAFLAAVESAPATPFDPTAPKQLLVTRFAAGGPTGTPTVIPAAVDDVAAVATAPRGDGVAVFWVEKTALRFAAVGATGQLAVAPKDVLPTGVDVQSALEVAAGPAGGFGVVFTDGALGGGRVRFVAVDASGAAQGSPRALDTAGGMFPAGPAIAGGPDGYGIVWRDATSMQGGIDFTKVDGAGTELVARRRISLEPAAGVMAGNTFGFAPASNAIVRTASGYVVAWPEVRQGTFEGGAWSVVQLARLDAAGVRQGAPAPLRAPKESFDEIEPTLLPFGDAVAVLWARGTHIYVCAGCVPDHRIDLVLVDPTDLVPVSNVVSVTNGGDSRAGGLLRREVAVAGSSLLTAFQLTFHVHSTAGAAAFRCDK